MNAEKIKVSRPASDYFKAELVVDDLRKRRWKITILLPTISDLILI